MKPITIIGGGLGGLTLGIALRRRRIPVTIFEAGHYPRHRVCGEFISGRGQQTLDKLGLLKALMQHGSFGDTAAFFLPGRSGAPVRRLESSAFCISRFELDSILANTFREAAGDLRENVRAKMEDISEGTIRASGRRPHPVEKGTSWFGLKVHARQLPLAAALEMHAFPNGYIGLCRLPGNEVNICGLFYRSRRREGVDSANHRNSPIPFPIPESSPLFQRLSSAQLETASFCSVAGLFLKPQRAAELPDCCVGDALTMTPPVTGNGMSMAFESAELAVEPLTAYAQGKASWPQTKEQIARACDTRFTRRLRWARWLQWMMFSPLFQKDIGALVLNSQLIWTLFFRRTRN